MNAILEDLRVGNYYLTLHAGQRMRERKISKADLLRLTLGVHSVVEEENGRLRVRGFDAEGERLTLVACYENKTIIVTVY